MFDSHTVVSLWEDVEISNWLPVRLSCWLSMSFVHGKNETFVQPYTIWEIDAVLYKVMSNCHWQLAGWQTTIYTYSIHVVVLYGWRFYLPLDRPLSCWIITKEKNHAFHGQIEFCRQVFPSHHKVTKTQSKWSSGCLILLFLPKSFVKSRSRFLARATWNIYWGGFTGRSSDYEETSWCTL